MMGAEYEKWVVPFVAGQCCFAVRMCGRVAGSLVDVCGERAETQSLAVVCLDDTIPQSPISLSPLHLHLHHFPSLSLDAAPASRLDPTRRLSSPQGIQHRSKWSTTAATPARRCSVPLSDLPADRGVTCEGRRHIPSAWPSIPNFSRRPSATSTDAPMPALRRRSWPPCCTSRACRHGVWQCEC